MTLHRNAKVADVFPCVAVDDLSISQGVAETHFGQITDTIPESGSMCDPFQQLKKCGLSDINLEGHEVSQEWRQRLAKLVLAYQDVFSKDKLDCGQATGFVHRKHLTEDRPFQLPYRQVPTAQCHNLKKCCPRWN